MKRSARRIDYDFDHYGDTPACLGHPESDLVDTRATSEGYGRTETGETSDVLLTVNVTIIANQVKRPRLQYVLTNVLCLFFSSYQDCGKYLMTNTTRNPTLRAKLIRALRFGLNPQLLCTVGDYNSTLNVYSVCFKSYLYEYNHTICNINQRK